MRQFTILEISGSLPNTKLHRIHLKIETLDITQGDSCMSGQSPPIGKDYSPQRHVRLLQRPSLGARLSGPVSLGIPPLPKLPFQVMLTL